MKPDDVYFCCEMLIYDCKTRLTGLDVCNLKIEWIFWNKNTQTPYSAGWFLFPLTK